MAWRNTFGVGRAQREREPHAHLDDLVGDRLEDGRLVGGGVGCVVGSHVGGGVRLVRRAVAHGCPIDRLRGVRRRARRSVGRRLRGAARHQRLGELARGAAAREHQGERESDGVTHDSEHDRRAGAQPELDEQRGLWPERQVEP